MSPLSDRSLIGMEPDALIRAATAAIAQCDLDAIARTIAPTHLLDSLLESVSRARYWQAPDEYDDLLSRPQITALLEPIAHALSTAPAAQWWVTPAALESQYTVAVEDPLHPGRAHDRADPAAGLNRWRTETLLREQRADAGPDDPALHSSGRWWSAPILPQLLSSTRTLGRNGPVGLSLVEDDWGWTAASCRHLRPARGASIFEISGPEDWSQLVAAYPLAVTRSRRGDWYRATGLDVAWAVPDYAAVSADFDAIHVTVLGYLTAAQRALPAGEAHTMLAGWGPDQTWWLTAGTAETGSPVGWILDADFSPDRTRWKVGAPS